MKRILFVLLAIFAMSQANAFAADTLISQYQLPTRWRDMGDGTWAQVLAISPSSPGAKTGANSTSVVPNTDTPFPVQGTSASGVADDATPPLKVGAVYQDTPDTYTNAQRGNVHIDPRGNLRAQIVTVKIGGSDGIANANVGFANDRDFGGNSQTLLGVAGSNYNGSGWDRVRGDANGTVTQPALSSTFWNYAAASGGITNTTTAVTVKAAAGASVRNYIDSMQCSSDALGAATELVLRDGASGTVIFRTKIGTAGIPSGVNLTFNPPLRGSANTLTEIVTLTATVTGSVYCNVQGYTGS